jgi:L-alanine-DL-glutamate epimerase-like enolase superfamily enzyme
MQILDVQYFPLSQRQEDPNWAFSIANFPVIHGAIIAIRTKAAIGYGYTMALPHLGSSQKSLRGAFEMFKPRLIGRSAIDIDPILADLGQVMAGNQQAMAGIDCALHDLLSRLMGVPMYALLGGSFRKTIPQIRILPIKAPAVMAQEARRLTDAGYRSLKIKLKGRIADDVDRVRAIREEVGSDVMLTLDPNQAYLAKDAIRALRLMDPYDVYLVEQPVPANDREGLKLVTHSVSQLVEADESAVTLDDVMYLAANRVVDAVSLKIPKLGGLRAAQFAAKVCHNAGIVYRVGATFGPRLMAAHAAQFAASLPRLELPCELAEFDHLHDDPFVGLEVDDGTIAVSEMPGAGISFNKASRPMFAMKQAPASTKKRRSA